MKIELRENGPLVIRGARIRIQVGEKEEIREGAVALCRCGGSENKPFCDGTHRRTAFQTPGGVLEAED